MFESKDISVFNYKQFRTEVEEDHSVIFEIKFTEIFYE